MPVNIFSIWVKWCGDWTYSCWCDRREINDPPSQRNPITKDAPEFQNGGRQRQSWRETSNHASTLHKAVSNHSSTRMASLACTYHRVFCAQQCSWIPTLLLQTFAASAVRLAKLPHYRSDNNGPVELSPHLFKVPSLAMATKRPFVSLYKLPVNNCPRSSLCLIMLVLCGDVEANPGPIKYLCMTCQPPVASTHHAMGCDSLVHIKCCGVTPVQYAAYQRGENLALWECPRCNPPVSTADVSASDSDRFDLSSHTEPTPPSHSQNSWRTD